MNGYKQNDFALFIHNNGNNSTVRVQERTIVTVNNSHNEFVYHSMPFNIKKEMNR